MVRVSRGDTRAISDPVRRAGAVGLGAPLTTAARDPRPPFAAAARDRSGLVVERVSRLRNRLAWHWYPEARPMPRLYTHICDARPPVSLADTAVDRRSTDGMAWLRARIQIEETARAVAVVSVRRGHEGGAGAAIGRDSSTGS